MFTLSKRIAEYARSIDWYLDENKRKAYYLLACIIRAIEWVILLAVIWFVAVVILSL